MSISVQTLKTISELEGPPLNEAPLQVGACLCGSPSVSRVSMTQHLAFPEQGNKDDAAVSFSHKSDLSGASQMAC